MHILRSFISFLIPTIILTGQTLRSSSYTCHNIQFTSNHSTHSAWDSSLNCSLSLCSVNKNNSCLTSQTPCFDYRTVNNISYCAPASLCSIFESCDNITYTCSTNTSVCVVNACCALRSVCLPLEWVNTCTIARSCELSFSPALINTAGVSPSSIATGDFNGDNQKDIVLTNAHSNTISVYLGNGDGTFRPETTYPTEEGDNPMWVAVGDFNGDHQLDLVLVNWASSFIHFFFGYGNGSFRPRTSLSIGVTSSSWVIVDDVNNDNFLDVVISHSVANSVSVYLGSGNGTFSTPTRFPTDQYPGGIVSADFNGDNQIDLALANLNSQSISILLGHGNGSFASQMIILTGSSPESIATGDFNHDNHTDLVIGFSGNGISVLLGYGNGSFGTQTAFPIGDDPISVAVADFDGDHHLDIVATYHGGNSVSVLLGFGNGSFKSAVAFATNAGPYRVVVDDFNNDNRPDLAFTHTGSISFSIMLNTCH